MSGTPQVIPLGLKDYFNAIPPSGDAELLTAVINPELNGLINALYGVSFLRRREMTWSPSSGPASLAGLP